MTAEGAPGIDPAETDWSALEMMQEESDVRHVVKDFTGKRGLSGKTDLTEDQAVLLTQLRLLQEDYHERFPELRLDKLPEWFETYRLSINRGSRKETVEILRGNIGLRPAPPEAVNGGNMRW